LEHIIFHNDVDGIISASLFLHYNAQEKKFNYFTSCLHPVNSTMRGETLKKILEKIPINEELAIFDFEFNKRATIWADHHYSPDFGPDQIMTDNIWYDPSAKSLVQILTKKFGDHFPDLSAMANMIDSASFPSPQFIFESDHPLMILRAYIETTFPSDMTYSRIVENIALNKCDVGYAIKKMGITYQEVKNIKNIALKIMKNILKFGDCSIIHQTRQGQFPRYSEFLMIPDIKYAIRISLSGPHHKYIQMGYNQWCGKQNTINIGEFFRNLSYGRGGGHFSVGACLIKNEDENKFLDDVDCYFNKTKTNSAEGADNMEKYGVDKEDNVEKRAIELVKTGMDIDEARKQSQKEQEAKSNAGDKIKL